MSRKKLQWFNLWNDVQFPGSRLHLLVLQRRFARRWTCEQRLLIRQQWWQFCYPLYRKYCPKWPMHRFNYTRITIVSYQHKICTFFILIYPLTIYKDRARTITISHEFSGFLQLTIFVDIFFFVTTVLYHMCVGRDAKNRLCYLHNVYLRLILDIVYNILQIHG